MMDIFSPINCDDYNRAVGTQNERNAWFYSKIQSLGVACNALDKNLTLLTEKVGDNVGLIDNLRTTTATLQEKFTTLQRNFNALSSDNIAFKEQMDKSLQDLTVLVSKYNGTVMKLSADVAGNTTRITALEAQIDPNLLRAIESKLASIDDQIKIEVQRAVDEYGKQLGKGFDSRLKTQDDRLSSQDGIIASLATQTNAVAASVAEAGRAVSINTKAITDLTVKEASDYGDLSNRISAEAAKELSARVAGDTQLQKNIDAEATLRSETDKQIGNDLLAEAGTRETNDKALNNRVDLLREATRQELAGEKAERINEEKVLSDRIDATNRALEEEADKRGLEDEHLNDKFERYQAETRDTLKEHDARIIVNGKAIGELQAGLKKETADRMAADAETLESSRAAAAEEVKKGVDNMDTRLKAVELTHEAQANQIKTNANGIEANAALLKVHGERLTSAENHQTEFKAQLDGYETRFAEVQGRVAENTILVQQNEVLVRESNTLSLKAMDTAKEAHLEADSNASRLEAVEKKSATQTTAKFGHTTNGVLKVSTRAGDFSMEVVLEGQNYRWFLQLDQGATACGVFYLHSQGACSNDAILLKLGENTYKGGSLSTQAASGGYELTGNCRIWNAARSDCVEVFLTLNKDGQGTIKWFEQ